MTSEHVASAKILRLALLAQDDKLGTAYECHGRTCRATPPGVAGRTANRRARFDFPCHCEERSDVVTEGNACGAISWYFVRFPGFFQEIATAFGLAMTVVVERWCGFAGVRQHPSLPCPCKNRPCWKQGRFDLLVYLSTYHPGRRRQRRLRRRQGRACRRPGSRWSARRRPRRRR